MQMMSMKMSREEAKDYSMIESKPPEYPYGLCISLDDEAMQKLGLTELPAVGAVFVIHAQAKVESTSAHSDAEGEQERCMSLQITDLAMEPQRKTALQSMYSNSNMNP